MVVISGNAMGEVFMLVGTGASRNCFARVVDSCDSVVTVGELGGVSAVGSVVDWDSPSTNAS